MNESRLADPKDGLLRVLVCGGRDYAEKRRVFDSLDELNPLAVIHGGCPTGADRFAAQWCAVRNCSEWVYRAHWEVHGRAAGPRRNQQMIDEGKPDMVLAFPGGRGTADMVRRAEKAGVPVLKVVPLAEHCDDIICLKPKGHEGPHDDQPF